MVQFRTGTFTTTGTATALNIVLGFLPDTFTLTNYTGYDTNAVVIQSKYFAGMTAGYALQQTAITDTDLVSKYISPSILTTNGFTVFSTGASWYNTIYTITAITNANPGVVTISGLTPTGGQALVNGTIVTISGVNGMTGVNTNRFVVSNLTIVGGGPTYTFTLYDLFGNPFSTISLGTYTSGGQIDAISFPPTGPVLNATNGQVITPAFPAGLQLDNGSMGITLGTSLFRANADVFYWEAFSQTPTGW